MHLFFKITSVILVFTFSLSAFAAGLCPIVSVQGGDFDGRLEVFKPGVSLSNLGFSSRGGGEVTVGGFSFFNNDGSSRVTVVADDGNQTRVLIDSRYGKHIYIHDKGRGCSFLHSRNGNNPGALVATANCNIRKNPRNPSCSI